MFTQRDGLVRGGEARALRRVSGPPQGGGVKQPQARARPRQELHMDEERLTPWRNLQSKRG